jgi:hypothetical protein
VVGYEPSTGIKKTYSNVNLNEPRIDRGGRYIGIAMNAPDGSLYVWDWAMDTITWTTIGSTGNAANPPGSPGAVSYAHTGSLRRRFMGMQWNDSYPNEFAVWSPDTVGSQRLLTTSESPAGKAATGGLAYSNGSWIQHPADLDDQWALYSSYLHIRPQPENYGWLAPGGMVYVSANGGRRLLGHPYCTETDYTLYNFVKQSSDGRYVMFNSNMHGAARTDLFLVETPVR